MAQWVLDYPADSTGADFPFDRPYLDLLDRCLAVRKAIDAFLRSPPEDRVVHRQLLRLARILDPVRHDDAFTTAATTLRRRASLFDELRSALRLHPTDTPLKARGPEVAVPELQDIKAAVDKLKESLQARRPQRGPAQDARRAIDLILAHLDRHGDSLWGHAIALPVGAGGGVRLVERTNNLLEGFYRAMKQGERRRSGRKTLADDFEHLPPEAALSRNLMREDYLDVVCGSIDELPHAFAELDAADRERACATSADSRTAATPEPTAPSTASLPKPDRHIVRSDAATERILAAAHSRAPRVDAQRALR
jgi:hypothetical protein